MLTDASRKREVLQDVVIWDRKRYQPTPRLCRADGPIGKYRRYCRQFYPELEAEARRSAPELTEGPDSADQSEENRI